MKSFRMTTVAINVACLLAILCVLVKSGELKKGTWLDPLLAVLIFSSPAVALGCLGYRPTNSKSLPIILLVSSLLSTAMWSLLACQFMAAKAVDSQSGLLAVFVLGIQVVIVVVATICFQILHKRDR